MLPLMMAGLALVLLALGKNDEALAAAREATKKAAERSFKVEDPRVVKLALASALVATRDDVEGGKLVSELTVELLDRASRLRDPEVRKTFLHAVDDHARVFALRSSLAGTE